MVVSADKAIARKSPQQELISMLMENKQQLEMVLPKHMTPDRMARLALTAFNGDSKLRQCSLRSIAASVMIASQMGLEIGVGGHGWLVPYGENATFVPGWQGLVELMNRSGRGSVWTGAVYEGDEFDWELGADPRLIHRPAGDNSKLTHVYAIGRVKGSEWPVIEVWTIARVLKHRDRYNKVGKKHYSFANDNNLEMYARKVALLQVLKYMPKSIELQAAVDVSYAADEGRPYTVDANMVVAVEQDPQPPKVEQDMDALADEVAKKAAEKPQSSKATKQKTEDDVPPEPSEKPEPTVQKDETTGDGSDVYLDWQRQIRESEEDVDLEIISAGVRNSADLEVAEKSALLKLVEKRRAEL